MTHQPSTFRFFLVLVVGALLVAGGAVYFWQRSQAARAAQEQATKAFLQQIGALAVMDGARQHVASVNLSLVPAKGGPAKLAAAVTALQNLPQLTALDASRTPFGDAEATGLAGLDRLKSLTLTSSQVTDKSLAPIGTLSELEALNLSGTAITGEGLSDLAGLTNLKLLDLSKTQLRGGLQVTRQMPNLEWLVLRGAELEQGALAPLAESPGLRTLSLEGAIIASKEVAALQEARPELRIHTTAGEESEEPQDEAPDEALEG